MTDSPTPTSQSDETAAKRGDPIIYHLENGDTLPGVLWESCVGFSKLRLLFNRPMYEKYGDVNGWFSKEFIESCHWCIPEACNYGTEPGEFQFARELSAPAPKGAAEVAEPQEVQELLEHLYTLAPDMKDEGLDHFDGYFVHWDEVSEALGRAWPRTIVGYAESPLELVARLIDERDALAKVATMAMTPHRDGCDQYSDWHERLREAARAALPVSPVAGGEERTR